MLWKKFGCAGYKSEELNRNRIPEMFYRENEKTDSGDVEGSS
jgi:hypothetical protein